MPGDLLGPVSSGPVLLLKITLKLNINLPIIGRRFVVRVVMDNSPSNIF